VNPNAETGREALMRILKRMELVAQTNVEVANRMAVQQQELVQGQALLAEAYSSAARSAQTTNTLLLKLCERLDKAILSNNVLADALDGGPVMEARANHGGRSLGAQAVQGLLGGIVNSVVPPHRQPPPPRGWHPQGRPY
jgi:hypothetical protein